MKANELPQAICDDIIKMMQQLHTELSCGRRITIDIGPTVIDPNDFMTKASIMINTELVGVGNVPHPK